MYTVIQSELIYAPEINDYTLKEAILEHTNDIDKAVIFVDNMNRMHPLKSYYIEDDDETQIYGMNCTAVNCKIYRTPVKPIRQS